MTLWYFRLRRIQIAKGRGTETGRQLLSFTHCCLKSPKKRSVLGQLGHPAKVVGDLARRRPTSLVTWSRVTASPAECWFIQLSTLLTRRMSLMFGRAAACRMTDQCPVWAELRHLGNLLIRAGHFSAPRTKALGPSASQVNEAGHQVPPAKGVETRNMPNSAAQSATRGSPAPNKSNNSRH